MWAEIWFLHQFVDGVFSQWINTARQRSSTLRQQQLYYRSYTPLYPVIRYPLPYDIYGGEDYSMSTSIECKAERHCPILHDCISGVCVKKKETKSYSICELRNFRIPNKDQWEDCSKIKDRTSNEMVLASLKSYMGPNLARNLYTSWERLKNTKQGPEYQAFLNKIIESFKQATEDVMYIKTQYFRF